MPKIHSRTAPGAARRASLPLPAARRAGAPLPVARLAGAALCVLLIAGCTPGATPVPVPSPGPEVAAACTDLVKALPAKVLDAKRRKTTPESPLTTAYGDPPIEMTCGVAAPAGTPEAQSKCFEVNGVGWFAKQVQNGYVFTTIGRALYFEVAVPNKYAPEANALTDVSDAVQKHDKLVIPCL